VVYTKAAMGGINHPAIDTAKTRNGADLSD
jgi:hypothetical protein